MRFFFFLLSVYVLIVQGEAQYQPYYDDSFSTYPINHYQNYYPDVDGRTPNSANEKRWFYGVSTTTTTATTTTTTTCTVSTVSACNTTGRKKKALEQENENIEPSPVNDRVEATKLPEVESLTKRESQSDLQFAYWRSSSSDYPLYELRSTFGRRPLSNNYNPFVRREMIVGDPRFAFFYVGFTTTATSTVTSTYKSTPICSQASNFNTC